MCSLVSAPQPEAALPSQNVRELSEKTKAPCRGVPRLVEEVPPYPRTIESNPELKRFVPIATEPVLAAIVLLPMATEKSPFARVSNPKATESNPTFGSSHCVPSTCPARIAALPGYHMKRVPAP